MLLSVEEFGFLMRVLGWSTRAGLPTKVEQIGRLAQIPSLATAKRLWPRVQGFFDLSEDGTRWLLRPADWFSFHVVPVDRQNLSHLYDSLVSYWGQRCVYCGVDGDLEIEHIVPISRGGTNSRTNLTLACRACNQKKGNKTAAEFGFPEVHGRSERIE